MTAIVAPHGGVMAPGVAGRHRRPSRGRGALHQTVNMVVALAFAGVLAALVLPRAAGWHTYVVESGSMGHTAPIGSLVEMKPIAAGSVRKGDIVLLHRANGTPVMHRVIQVMVENGQVTVRTKGDANPTADPDFYPVPAFALTPTVILPRLGLAVPVLKSTEGRSVLVAVAGLLLIRAALRRRRVPGAASHARTATN